MENCLEIQKVFNKHAKNYDEWYEKNKYIYLSEVEALKIAILKDKKGLEIGVGTVRFAAVLGIEYRIDPSEEMLKIAQKRGIKTFLGYGEKLPFNDKEFDFVAIIITICFVRNPEKAIKEAKRVLKIGGKLIIGIIDKNSPLGQFYLEKKKQGHLFYKYANFYSVDEIVKMLEKYGFGNFKFYQTIFKPIEEFKEVEMPKEGYGEGSFVIIFAERL